MCMQTGLKWTVVPASSQNKHELAELGKHSGNALLINYKWMTYIFPGKHRGAQISECPKRTERMHWM